MKQYTMWWSSGTLSDYLNINIYVVLEIILKKRGIIGIQYNTDNIQMICIKDVSYSTVT